MPAGGSCRSTSCWVERRMILWARLDEPLSTTGGGRTVPWVTWRAGRRCCGHARPAGLRLTPDRRLLVGYVRGSHQQRERMGSERE